jgi:hypothetical protein
MTLYLGLTSNVVLIVSVLTMVLLRGGIKPAYAGMVLYNLIDLPTFVNRMVFMFGSVET